MGTKYTTNTEIGYNSSPPADNGSVSDSNKLTWSKHKTKLGDPVLVLAQAINTDLLDYVDVEGKLKTAAYTTIADDDRRVIECTGSPTITLGAAATMGAGYRVTVKNKSTGTVTVATSDTIDGSGSSRTLSQYQSETYTVDQAAGDYLLTSNRGIGLSETATLTNKTLTSPVLNGTLSGTAFLDQDTMSSNSDIAVASQQSIKAYVDTHVEISADLTLFAAGTSGGGQWEATANSAGASYAHGLTAKPDGITLYLQCTTTQSPYQSGDRIPIASANANLVVWMNATNVGANAYSSVTTDIITVPNGTTTINLLKSSWKLMARAIKYGH